MFRFTIRGVVQGVGFRPFIANAAKSVGIQGYVQNIGDGVVVVVDNKDKLFEILRHPPKLARIDSYIVEETNDIATPFYIKASEKNTHKQEYSEIPPDLYLCKDCLKDLRAVGNRREDYFFTTCTNCGPRFSIVKRSPYDRPNTTMALFNMCEKCAAEYVNSKDRRYHAQTIACNNCGPKLYFKSKSIISYDNPIVRATDEIKRGNLVAIKGIGGFHIACDLSHDALNKLRRISHRANKPYAIMCNNIEMVRKLVELNSVEEELLTSSARPIVVCKKKYGIDELRHISELSTLGIMLPYTALHHLLFDYIESPIVLTSANIADEPITTRDEEQFVDCVLSHDREIENYIDDSVMKVIDKHPLFLRRSRGFVPQSINIDVGSNGVAIDDEEILALGAEMNNTFCSYKKGSATLSQFMGTTSNSKTMENCKVMLQKFMEMTQCKPKTIICDLHPEYETTKYAQELALQTGAQLVRVQHHKAHAYSVALEHKLDSSTGFISIICDGLGYGEDSKIWGGEVFLNDKRIGHLEEQLQLGGDSATQHPAKMLLSILLKFMPLEAASKYMRDQFDSLQLDTLKKQYDARFNCPITTSCGRVLDAASFLLGFCSERTYDGRPAILLDENSTQPFDDIAPVINGNILMTTPLFAYLCANLTKDKGRLAATVQMYIARGLYEVAVFNKKKNQPIIFSGGCAYSHVMASFMLSKGVLMNEKVPAGDGGISFGQIGYYLANKTRNN